MAFGRAEVLVPLLSSVKALRFTSKAVAFLCRQPPFRERDDDDEGDDPHPGWSTILPEDPPEDPPETEDQEEEGESE